MSDELPPGNQPSFGDRLRAAHDQVIKCSAGAELLTLTHEHLPAPGWGLMVLQALASYRKAHNTIQRRECVRLVLTRTRVERGLGLALLAGRCEANAHLVLLDMAQHVLVWAMFGVGLTLGEPGAFFCRLRDIQADDLSEAQWEKAQAASLSIWQHIDQPTSADWQRARAEAEQELVAALAVAAAEQERRAQAAPQPAADQADGPTADGGFHWRGVTHSFKRARYQYVLLRALWGRSAVEEGALMAQVYGANVDGKERALRKLTHDLTETLTRWGVPFEVTTPTTGSYLLKQVGGQEK